MHIDCTGDISGCVSPYPFKEFVARDCSIAVFSEIVQQVELTRLQSNVVTTECSSPVRGIEKKATALATMIG